MHGGPRARSSPGPRRPRPAPPLAATPPRRPDPRRASPQTRGAGTPGSAPAGPMVRLALRSGRSVRPYPHTLRSCLPVQAGEPGRDRPLITLRHDQAGHLVRAEQPGPLVLVTDDRGIGADDVAAVGDHQHVPALADVVLPAVQQRPGRHLPAGLLADLAHHTVSGI